MNLRNQKHQIKKKHEEKEELLESTKIQDQLKVKSGKNKVIIYYNGRLFNIGRREGIGNPLCHGCFFLPHKCPTNFDDNFKCDGNYPLKRIKIK